MRGSAEGPAGAPSWVLTELVKADAEATGAAYLLRTSWARMGARRLKVDLAE